MKELILGSLEQILIFVGIILATVVIATIFNRFFKRFIKHTAEELKSDTTNFQFLRHGIRGLIYIVGLGIAIYAMPNLRTLANSMLAGAGILAVAVGFASQQALSNVISGVFIIIFKPFRVHDRVSVRTFSGVIEDITLRHTVIRDFENRRIIVPNAVISDEILINANYEDDRICKWIDMGISYDSDIVKAKGIMLDEILKHPLLIDGRNALQIEENAPLVLIRVTSLNDWSVTLRAWAWSANPVTAFEMACDLNESIKKQFEEEGIEIPFPYRTIVHKDSIEKEQSSTI